MGPYIYGTHDPLPDSYIQASPQLTWVLFPREIGSDASNTSGDDYRRWSNDLGLVVMVRLQHGWGTGGCIPVPGLYDAYAQRAANYIAASPGVYAVVVGNEFNFRVEWPSGLAISPQNAALCFVKVYHKIKAVRPQVLISPGAIAPWNIDYQDMDWLEYQRQMLAEIERLGVLPDFLTVHTYTHGADPALIESPGKMNPPYQDRYYHFLAFSQFLDPRFVPALMQKLPVFVTETDQDQAWENVNSGWVQNAYRAVDDWNKTHDQKIYALLLYRALAGDAYDFSQKSGILADFTAAMAHNYSIDNTNGKDDPPMFRVSYQTSFEEAFYDYQNAGEVTVPTGWLPGWKQTNPEEARPEYDAKVRPQPEVRTGNQAANFFSSWRKMRACLYKIFNLTPGVRFRASVWGMAKFSGNATIGMRLVIDPDGGNEWEKAGLPASQWWSNVNNSAYQGTWAQLVCEGVVGTGGQICVFLQGNTDSAIEHHGTHWDDFLLEVEDTGTTPPPAEPPTPPPTGTGLQGYIDAVRAALDALESYTHSTSIRALPID